ncbi:hypothetical protein ACOME3_002456 [Neoechinorhynchus agilis]
MRSVRFSNIIDSNVKALFTINEIDKCFVIPIDELITFPRENQDWRTVKSQWKTLISERLSSFLVLIKSRKRMKVHHYPVFSSKRLLSLVTEDELGEQHHCEVRFEIHKQLGLPTRRPMFSRSQSLFAHQQNHQLLRSVHLNVAKDGIVVDGPYDYYHYLCDGTDDKTKT